MMKNWLTETVFKEEALAISFHNGMILKRFLLHYSEKLNSKMSFRIISYLILIFVDSTA